MGKNYLYYPNSNTNYNEFFLNTNYYQFYQLTKRIIEANNKTFS